MPNFIPTDTFDNVPSLEDGKPANAAYLNRPHQALVDRTHHLHKTITDGGLTREGATRIREVADEAALKALTGMQDGEYAAVASLGGATFRYSASAADPELERWVVKPASGAGCWLNTAFALTGGPMGLVVADPNERIPAALPKNGVVAIETAKGAVLTTAKGGDDWLVVDGLSMAVDVLEGDIVDVDVSLNVGLGGTLVHGWVCLAVDGTPPVPLDASKADVTVETRTRVSTCTRFEATAAGTISLVTAIKADSATNTDTITAVGDAVMRATVYRP